MKKIFVLLILTAFLFSCGKEDSKTSNSASVSEAQKKEVLVTSIPPLKWLVQKISGDNYEVISIIQPNMNHELFEPKPNDLKILENSRLFFTYNALNFEKEISESINDKNKVVNLLENVDKSLLMENNHGHEHDDDHGHGEKDHHHDEEFDPHVWFSLDMMPKVAENIKNRLTESYPENKEVFEKNYNSFLAEL